MYFQVQTHVQTARESPDLNMDFSSFEMRVNSYTNRHLCTNNISIAYLFFEDSSHSLSIATVSNFTLT